MNSQDNQVNENVAENKIFWYKVDERPVSPGCQPLGFIDLDEKGGNQGIIAYDRPLTKAELYKYEMKEWKEKEPIQMKEKEVELEKV